MKEPVRNIRDELYKDIGYDALWRLPNAGFVFRLGAVYVFLDPVMSSPHPFYADMRQQANEAGELPFFRAELKHYDPASVFNEVHDVPLRAEEVEKADHVLITHEHEDHLDADALGVIDKLNPTVLAPRSCHPPILGARIAPRSVVEAVHGERHEYEGFSVEVVPANHTNSVAAAVSPDACGYLLRTKHGNIFLMGDGRFDHEDKATITGLDVAYLLVPINDTNLGVGFAALLTHLLQPRVVVPVHYGYTFPPVRSQGGHPAEFVTALAARNYNLPTTDIVILQPGGRLVLA